MPEATARPTSIYVSPSYNSKYSHSQTVYTSSPTSFTRPTSTIHEVPKPTSPSTSRLQSSALSRPSTIYTSANIAQSFKVIRRQRTRKSNSSRRDTRNVLNQTLDNFYNILRRTKTDQTVKSAKTWVNEYENYRKSVIYEEKEYERFQSSMMMDDDDSSLYRNSVYDRSYGASLGVTEKRVNSASAINGRRQMSKNSVGVEGYKINEPLYSNYF
ncbi:908_t:CDS:1 [Acaulospora morrowiae]|uniref:908_t:CDS:1 n=1 Tax=Acaulospora morrowiae TaxID=94023 RepID=A0A9N8ZPS9_9GLOM|nr:908_t:CDS:1 [Acaulospora morrowiae]